MAQLPPSQQPIGDPDPLPRPTSTHVYEEADGSYSWEIWDWQANVITSGNEPTRAHALEAMFKRFEFLQEWRS